MRWYHQPEGDSRDWQEVTDIVWRGGDDSDAAVLAVDFPPGIQAAVFLSDAMPVTGTRWESEGFASVGKRPAGRKPVPLKGEVYSMADTARTFMLGVDDPTSLPNGWKGASGSPVVVNGAVLGVVVTCPPDFDNQRLRATPIWRLFQQNDFCIAIGIDAHDAYLAFYRGRIASVLEREKGVAKELAKQLGGIGAWPDQQPATSLHIAEVLTQLTPQTALELLDQVHSEYRQTGNLQMARIVKEVVYWVLPAVFDAGVVEGVRLRERNVQGALIELPVATYTIAEIVMAGFDRRRIRYRRPVSGQDPDGELRLPHVPEVGIDRDCSEFQKAFQTNLEQHLLDGDLKTLYDAFHNYITGDPEFVSKTQQRRGLSKETRIELAAGKLRHKANRQQTHYFVFDMPPGTKPEVRRKFQSVLDELKGKYDAIVFLNLSLDGELINREHNEFVYRLTDLHGDDQASEGIS